jgi:hypothetical protein
MVVDKILIYLSNFSAPTVQLNQGILIGTTNGLVDQFLGVPYANPPIGDLRWKVLTFIVNFIINRF